MVLCVVLVRAPRVAGDGSIIYEVGNGAEATGSRLCDWQSPLRLAVASATGSSLCDWQSPLRLPVAEPPFLLDSCG